DQSWDILPRPVGEQIEAMHSVTNSQCLRAFDDLLNASFKNARMAGNSAREGAIFDARTVDDSKDIIDMRSTKQHIDADFHCGCRRCDLTFAVERDDFEIGFRATIFDGFV